MEQFVKTSDDGIDPIDYIKSHFSKLTEREISVLVGSIAFLGEVKYQVLMSVLGYGRLEIEEKIGRLMQTDLLDGKFTDNSFVLDKFNYEIKKQHPNLTLDDRTMLAYIKARFELSIDELQKTFDLSYESTVYIISSFISRGLISSYKIDENRFAFVVHYHYEKRTSETITELEKQIAGYGLLRGKLKISDFASDLQQPEHKIISTIISLVLSDTITAHFHLEEKLFGGAELLIEIGKLQLHFDKQSIALLSDQERKIIGFISLRKNVQLSEIHDVLKISPVNTRKISSVLVATQNFEFIMPNKNTLKVEAIRSYSPNRTIETLTTIHNFNYRILLGLLKTQKRVSIKEIATKMEKSESTILLALINSYLEGFVVGHLNSKYVFSLSAVRKSSQKGELTLEDWERILMGALISEKVISWPKIAALLNVDRGVARNRAFEFISRGFANSEAKDTVLMLNEIPSLPPLVQLSKLDEIEQQIFGYMVASSELSIKKIKQIFSINTIQTFRYVYYLCGSGLFLMQREGDNLKIDREVSFEPVLSVNELDAKYQNLIKIIQDSESSQISFRDVRRKLNISNKDVIKRLSYLIANGYYKGKFENSVFIKTSRLLTTHLSSTCIYCNTDIEKLGEPCNNCERTQPFCGVCKGHLNSSEQLVACPHCQNLSHSLHLRQWLKIKGECPFCRNKISERDLLVRQPLL